MSRFTQIIGFSGALTALFATFPPGLCADQVQRPVFQGQAVEAKLNPNASAITYWVRGPDGWHVVTTVDTVIAKDKNAEKHAIVRFEAVLLSGQSQVISVPVPIGEQQRYLRIRRFGDELQVVCEPDLREASDTK